MTTGHYVVDRRGTASLADVRELNRQLREMASDPQGWVVLPVGTTLQWIGPTPAVAAAIARGAPLAGIAAAGLR